MDVHGDTGGDAHRKRNLRRHCRENGTPNIYSVRVRIFYSSSFAVFRVDANRFAYAAGVDWPSVLCVGERFQPF